MLCNLFARLWTDDAGAVIATEYLMLGSLVAAGSATGMVAMRDSVIDEYKELGQSVRDIRQQHGVPAARLAAASRTAAAPAADGVPNVPTAQELRFSCPTP